MLGLCEALALSAKANLPIKTVLEVLSTGTADSPIVAPAGVSRDWILASRTRFFPASLPCGDFRRPPPGF